MVDIGKHISAVHKTGAQTIRAVGGAIPYAGKAAANISRATGISQDNVIFAMILFAFMVYITIEGELPTYLGFFIPQTQLGPPVDTVSAGTATIIPATTNPATGTQIQPGLTANPFEGLTGGSGILGTNILTGLRKLFGF